MTLKVQEINKDADVELQPVNTGGVFPDETQLVGQPGIMLWVVNNDIASVTITIPAVTDPFPSARAGALEAGDIVAEIQAGEQTIFSIPEVYWDKRNLIKFTFNDGSDTTQILVAAMVVNAAGGSGTVEIPA